ncbi:hypothetical protein [Nocardioides sp. R-C-SC26]|uniref:hypothetical protein n=1 Tax=Nocardioides sp. R-C-SC26 TaxID=2870414 RepID=UPI001E3C26C8|nr:hypothetical protein [Nocardioides sp. R-C-SC26]
MVRTVRSTTAAAMLTTVLLVAAGGCGDDGPGPVARDPEPGSAGAATPADATGSETSADATSGPPCVDIWKDGELLPRRYAGCTDEDGGWIAAAKRECSLGIPLITFGDAFYAVPGGPVNPTQGPVEKDRDYRSALASCTA